MRGVSDPAAGWGGGEAKKHEIYVATIGGHLIYDLFLQGWGGMVPSAPPDLLLNEASETSSIVEPKPGEDFERILMF